MSPKIPDSSVYDVAIIGAALSGAATAHLLLQRNPRLRIVLLERSPTFKRRVGEATVEVSGYFLGRVLGLTEHLNEKHLVKQGLRFWFKNDKTKTVADCSETGPGFNVRFPSYQIDRSTLDEHLLAQVAANPRVTLLRPARVTDVALDPAPGAYQKINYELVTETPGPADGATQTLTARWIVDASGFQAFLARKNNWLRPNTDHPIASVWTRWRGVKNWDSPELAAKYPEWARRTKAVRYTATNHLVGLGWWSWWIPLKGGDVSIGLVYDQRLTELPPGENLSTRLRDFLEKNHPVPAEFLADATPVEHDAHYRRNLPYSSTHYAGSGYALVGDAAAFIDPFYSPGMDWIAYTTTATAAMIDANLRGRPAAPLVAKHNHNFTTSYQRWFDAIYRDKYYYMAEQELMTLAFRLDITTYYLGVVAQPFGKQGQRALELPSFASEKARIPAKLIAHYNRRLSTIARDRLARGTWGKTNHGHHNMVSFALDYTIYPIVLRAIFSYLFLELREGWRTWFRTPPHPPELPPHPTRQKSESKSQKAENTATAPA